MQKERKPIFAIDPGNTESAFCVYYPEIHSVADFGKVKNEDMRQILMMAHEGHEFRIEMIASYGMPVGKDVFETCKWIGRFEEIIRKKSNNIKLVYRKDVKMHLCNSTRAKDGNVRQAIIDLFPASGGGKTPQIGTKKEPGPLYGINNDVWAALGVALTV